MGGCATIEFPGRVLVLVLVLVLWLVSGKAVFGSVDVSRAAGTQVAIKARVCCPWPCEHAEAAKCEYNERRCGVGRSMDCRLRSADWASGSRVERAGATEG